MNAPNCLFFWGPLDLDGGSTIGALEFIVHPAVDHHVIKGRGVKCTERESERARVFSIVRYRDY